MIKTRLKTKDVYVDICGTRYFKSRKDGNADFTTRPVSKGGVYSWYEGSKVDNALNCWTHKHCTPYLAHVKRTQTVKWTWYWNCFERAS